MFEVLFYIGKYEGHNVLSFYTKRKQECFYI